MLAIIFSALFTAYVHAGGARHVFYLDPAQRSLVIELNWVAQVFSVSGIATSKISVSLLIYRLQGPSKWRTWFLIFCSVSSMIVLAGTIVSLLGRCSPPKALWIPGAGTCWDGTKVGYFDIFAAGALHNHTRIIDRD